MSKFRSHSLSSGPGVESWPVLFYQNCEDKKFTYVHPCIKRIVSLFAYATQTKKNGFQIYHTLGFCNSCKRYILCLYFTVSAPHAMAVFEIVFFQNKTKQHKKQKKTTFDFETDTLSVKTVYELTL